MSPTIGSSVGGTVASAIENLDHAALLCDRTDRPVDVSYWPSESVGIWGSGSASFRVLAYRDEVAAEGRMPAQYFSAIKGGYSNAVHLGCLLGVVSGPIDVC